MLQFQGKTIDTAIFDMDGTMFDTERLRFQTLSQASEELFGKPFTEPVLLGSLGLSATKAEALAKQHYGQDFPYAAIRRRADELELAHVRTQGVPIKPGLLPVLERLRKSGLKMAVATSSRRAIAEEYLINANIYKYFDLCVCGDEVVQGKPHPEIFVRAAEALNSQPAQCLMFEDSENGVRSAADAGGVVILVEDIQMPPPAVARRAFGVYGGLSEFLQDLAACTPKMSMPAVTEPFPQAVNLLKAGIHGFGAMGGGYLAQVFSHWDGYTRPCEIIASTGNALLREAIDAFGKFSVRYGSLAFDQTIEQLRVIDAADTDAVAGMYRDCEIVALCVPEQAVAAQAGVIAQGLAERFAAHGRELTVLVVLNKVGGAEFVRAQVEAALLQRVASKVCQRILERTSFSETVVTRIVSKLTEDALVRQLRIKSELYKKNVVAVRESSPHVGDWAEALPGDTAEVVAPHVSTLRDAGEPASALAPLHLILFNSETDMPLYVQQGSDLLEHLRQIDTVADIAVIQLLKNRLWNGTHAIVAWYAALLGYPSIGHAMGDARVQALMDQLLDAELAPALAAQFPELRTRLAEFIATFRNRCAHAFKDPCERVGRDPLRKLQRGERVLGSLAMAAAQGVAAPALAFGAALAVHYALHHPPAAEEDECRTIRALYARREALQDVLAWRGEYHGAPFDGLDPVADAALLAAVQLPFDGLQAGGLDYCWESAAEAGVG
ncbi:bifunctional mannitol-1-phosphate dehydrogenase/phosphatase [Alicycliphilus denitrificans]|uniref:HAD-superfamily hydrolase, subfamily IA, variant 3 n=1 Tax=Alicycliphilus denitrificans (strain DSM 14773 / CIP 107495 / K601) TaxID=596154 RepID=F4GDC0_ALIDK|nr:HAD family phosphatase [Alicycliphilus denitrificans]AEB85949.1 HAD-superfamily hydrolase, subfamily IA, variant 3 [Alicycliphilus denitrificans K601]